MKKTFWGDYNVRKYLNLSHDIECQHLIVGGGVAGLFVAHFLLENGASDIVIIEKNTIGSGSTGHSAGMLVMSSEQATWAEIAREYGYTNAKHYSESQQRIYQEIIAIVKKYNIKCDLQKEPLVNITKTKSGMSDVISDFVTRKKIGLKSSVVVGESNTQKIFNAKGFNLAETTGTHLSVNPLLFAQGVVTSLVKRGVRIYEDTACLEITPNTAVTMSGKIRFKTVTECRGAYDTAKDINVFLTTIAITNTLSQKTLSALRAEDKDMFVDSGKRSFHYGRFTADNRMLVGYGDVLRKDAPRDEKLHKPHYDNIKRFIAKAFPYQGIRIVTAWSARYALTKTKLPVVRVLNNKFRINGAGTQIDSAMCSEYIAYKILKKKHPLDRLFRTAN